MATLDHVEAAVEARQEAGDGGLAGAGIPAEHEVLGRLDHGHVTLGPEALDPQQGGEEADLGLDRVEPDQTVEFGQEVLDVLGRGERLWLGRPLGGPLGGAVRGLAGRPAAFVARSRASVEPIEQGPLEPHDRSELQLGGEPVERGRRVGQRHGGVVVATPEVRAVAAVDGAQQLEQLARLVEEVTPARDQVGVAQIGRHRPARQQVVVGEGGEQGPQLVVAVAAVGADHRTGEVERLDEGVAFELGVVDRGAGGRLPQGATYGGGERAGGEGESSVHRPLSLLPEQRAVREGQRTRSVASNAARRVLSCGYQLDPLVKGAGRLARMTNRFESVDAVRSALGEVDYLADDAIAGIAYLADRLQKPVLIEGPAGTGKTQLAKSIAEMTDSRLIRLQCYEGLDESKALYEWNYKKQLLRIQTQKGDDAEWTEIQDDIFSDEFLLTRPLLEAIRADDPVVLLIDEVDRVEVETEALLLEILSDYQVSIPELGTIEAKQIPLVFLTSNNTRELSEALKRRCLFLHLDYPEMEREKEIVQTKVPDISENLADQVARIVRSIRQLELKKAPSVSETLDWAKTLILLGIEQISEDDAKETAHILLKYRSDIEKAIKEFSANSTSHFTAQTPAS